MDEKPWELGKSWEGGERLERVTAWSVQRGERERESGRDSIRGEDNRARGVELNLYVLENAGSRRGQDGRWPSSEPAHAKRVRLDRRATSETASAC